MLVFGIGTGPVPVDRVRENGKAVGRLEKPRLGDGMAVESGGENEVLALKEKVAVLERSVKDFERKSRFFELLIRSLPGVFYLTDESLHFQNWNKNLEKMTGYSPDELKDRTIYDVFSGVGLERIRGAVEIAFSKGEAFEEAELVTKDGTTIPHFFTGVSAKIEDTAYLLGMGTDLSARKRAEDALRESEEFYRMLAERMTFGVMLFQDSRIVFANDALASMFGYEDPDRLLGEDVMDRVTEEFREGMREMISTFERGASIERFFQARWTTRESRKIWVEGRATLIQLKGLPTVFMTLRDVTEAKEKEIWMQEEAEHLRRENISLRSSMKDRYRLGKLVGKSPAMQEVYELILNAAATSANVIIHGESGTGKELVARAIHEMSHRSAGEFVPVNCAAIPENLLESEFFGHKKGAFSGAHADKRGYLDLADRGTLFLDEVGELSLGLQAKLLRAIEGGGYSPVGGSASRFSDFRIIAATNLDLQGQLREGAMREDFFYRIHVIPIDVPPLRERREDIPLLLEHLLRLYSEDGRVPPLPGHVIEVLIRYDWPGNVRELQNVVQRYITVKQVDLPAASSLLRDGSAEAEGGSQADAPRDLRLRDRVDDAERAALLGALESSGGNRSKAAKALGISRRTILRKMKRFGIS
jgi:PAS domain S-box-containing protein